MKTPADDLRILLDFDSIDEVSLFSSLGDGVMGGISSGHLALAEPGIAVFEGRVSLERGGGFASVRSQQRDWGTRGVRAFVLRVRGDGKRYRFNVRTPGGPAAFRYEAPFEPPAGRWSEIEIPLASLAGKLFGQQLPLAAPPDPERIRSLGFMVSDRQAGPFRLEIDWIGVREGGTGG
jgi:monofunctional biosynthetic peptidoglycan transglycosylase